MSHLKRHTSHVTRHTSVSDRLFLARSLMASHGCSHLFVNDPVDVEYLSGFHSSNAYLLISKRKNIIFTDFRYQEAVKKHCTGHPDWLFVLIKDAVFPFIERELPAHATIGFQADVVTVDTFGKMKKAFRGNGLVPLDRLISDISIVKSRSEVTAMRDAAAIGDAALREFCGWLKTGVSEKEAAAKLDRLCSAGGSEKPSFDTIMLFGKNSALPHGRPGLEKLAKGDFVLIDFGCTVRGFCSDMTRTFVFGKASARQRELHALVLKAQEAARKAARAGIFARALDAVGRDIIQTAGFGGQFGHGLGHGVGLRIHEQPRLNEKCESILLTGSVVTVEPGIYLPGFGGVRIEDMVLLTGNGSKHLTHFPRELMEL
jgi:Xaa-Pro aminopeptidase